RAKRADSPAFSPAPPSSFTHAAFTAKTRRRQKFFAPARLCGEKKGSFTKRIQDVASPARLPACRLQVCLKSEACILSSPCPYLSEKMPRSRGSLLPPRR